MKNQFLMIFNVLVVIYMRVSRQFYFFYEKISHAQKSTKKHKKAQKSTKKHKKAQKAQKAQNAIKRLSLRCFLCA